MRKLFFLLLVMTVALQARSAVRDSINPALTPQQYNDLFYTGKLWGFLKYYHPVVASGTVNWDDELVKMMPRILGVKSREQRDTLLLHWVQRLGDVPSCTTCSDSVLALARQKPAFQWLSDGYFSKELSALLQHIVKNRKQGDSYYMKFISQDGIELPLPQHEAAYGRMSFPPVEYRLLALFRFWNVVEYWYPYKYGPLNNWDDELRLFLAGVPQQKDAKDYVKDIRAWLTRLQDGHGFIRSAVLDEITGTYYMPFTIKMIENKAVITSFLNDSLARVSGVNVGDVIESVDGKKMNVLIDSLRNCTPASNEGDFLRKAGRLLVRSASAGSILQLKRKNELQTIHTINYKPANRQLPDTDPPLFAQQRDTTGFFLLPGSIGYINMGELDRKDSAALKKMVTTAKGLIIDNRQNADESRGTGAGDIVANLILPKGGQYVRFGSPTASYPGVMRMTPPTDMGTEGSDSCYKGKIVILVDNGTISVGEFMTMIFRHAKQAIVAGTTTAGADGNVSYLAMPGNILVQYTGLGVYYPDGKETQRVGIVPGIAVTPTVEGFRQGRDEILEAGVKYLKR